MKNSNLILAIGVFCVMPVCAEDPFAELDNEMVIYEQESVSSGALENEFQQYVTAQDNDYKNWLTLYLKEFDQFQSELVEKWGEGDLSQKQRNVEFSKDKNVKSVIDYENEQITVALLVDKTLSQKEAEQQLQLKMQQLMSDKDSNLARLFEQRNALEGGEISIADVQYSPQKKQQVKNIIIKQTQAQAQEIDKQSDRAQLPESLLSESESKLLATQEKTLLLKSSQTRLNKASKNYQKAEKHAPKNKKIIQYTVNIPKNSLAKRAQKYSGFAEKEGRIHDIPAALVMAVMHSESAFDPRAKSAVPAYGLMQIVPRTAGHDVNKLLRNIDKPMSKDDLYTPSINVETGTAYLNILDKRYLRSITDDQSRLYCTIAAYNTGAGNVARVFNQNGSRNIKQASVAINKLSPDQVYQKLMAKLPYDETKHYLKRVHGRISLYQNRG